MTLTIAMILGILDIIHRAQSVTAMSASAFPGAGEKIPFRFQTLAGGYMVNLC